MPEKKKTASQSNKTEAVIYLGPEIPGTVSRGVVFNNGLTARMENAVKELPALAALLVPVHDVVKAKKELKEEVSAIRICYRKAEEYAAQKGAKG
ncbi:MAG: hypothetical protein J6C19_05700 [Lachnospiraceae bacterium]|nr:hypothetical protein [Lachnospiraceae bacterium]